MRSMRYIDRRGQQQTLTFPQWVYLEAAGRGFEQGWGGLRSTLVVRLLRERGLIFLDDRSSPWRVTGREQLGDQVIAAWRERADRKERISLHRYAPWANRTERQRHAGYLGGGGREWFTQAGGRYFKVAGEWGSRGWSVQEINRTGRYVRWIAAYARNLPAARQAIADTVAGVALDEVARRALNAPAAPTGRAARIRKERGVR